MPDKQVPSAYGDAFADIYDEWYSTLSDDDFVAALARRLPTAPSTILELGVGTGRLIRKLVELRAPIRDSFIGTDASEKMLEIARSVGIDNIAKLECSDFSRTMPSGPFDAIFVGYNTLFNLPDEESIASCLSLVSKSLAADGFFMCDLVIPRGDSFEEFSEERIMANGDHVTSVSNHDPSTRRISGAFIHSTSDGNFITRPWSVHYVPPHQLDALADQAGLRLVERAADGDGTLFTSDSSRHISTYILR